MQSETRTGLADGDTAFLAGGGELGALMRAKDWSGSPLGPPAIWPRSLKTVVRIMLTSSQPIWIGWGRELTYLYNDPYKAIIGGKHPRMLGEPTASVWSEIWNEIAPLLASALSGDGTFVESQLLIMERNGYPEETYYTFSYSPIPDDDGRPAGIICANSDETRRVISERQLGLLRDVAACATEARTVPAAAKLCADALAANARDITFAMIFLRPTGHGELSLAAHTGVDDALLELESVAFAINGGRWRASDVLASGAPVVLGLDAAWRWPGGAWRQPSKEAMVLPLASSGESGHEGLLVVGLNPFRLATSVDYRSFLMLVAQQVAAALASADSWEAQRQRADPLAELDRAKTEFFSNVSHEFRTPLTLMLGPLTDMLEGDSVPHALRESLEIVERSALRLSKLVNALFEFSRIEAGRHQSMFRPTDLAHLTSELASNFRSAMSRAGLAFDVRCEPLPEPVYIDREQWERIVLNLLSNALKFTFTGGVTVRLHGEGPDAVLTVADSGVGLPEHELPRLFERFHRVQGIHGRTHEGSGIGLALVQELVRLHGGSVAATSRVGEGTTFTVRVPFGRAHLAAGSVEEGSTDEVRAQQAGAYVQEALRWLPGEQQQNEPTTEASDAGLLIGERYRSTWGARIVVADDNADLRST